MGMRHLLFCVGTVLAMSAAAARADGPGPLLPLEWVLPPHAEILARSLQPFELGLRMDLYLSLPEAAQREVDETFVESVVRSALEDAVDRGQPVQGVIPWVATRDGGWVPLPALLPRITPPPAKASESLIGNSPTRAGRRPGLLSGKVVYVSAGHGWTWTPTLARWATQRGNTNSIVEDFVSVETINAYLVHYLENAGATVFTVRERDFNPNLVIVDDGGVQGGGLYRESGAWRDSTIAGFGTGQTPYRGTTNPFSLGKNRIIQTVNQNASAEAVYIPEIPEDGYYQVYASWSTDAGAPRSTDAHYVIRHGGGETHLRVNQQRHGSTWYPLGQWYFYAGQDELTGSVTLMNDTAGVGGQWVSADAIRFGAGLGDAGRGTAASGPKGLTSGRPRWEENARYHSQFNGAPSSVYAYTSDERNDDVGSRPRYAAWQNETGEDSVYVAWHTNAPNPARGTVTYIYGPNPPNGGYDFTGVAGSDRLARLMHDEIVADIRAEFEPNWQDRGVKTAYFGEVNKSHNPEMPAVLVEVAFHDTEADAAFLRNPRFRQVVARSYYQGIVRYFAEKAGVPAVFSPEPPLRLVAKGLGATRARLSWLATPRDTAGGDLATGYRVYRSHDGRAFDDGVDVGPGTSWIAEDMTPGVPSYFKVTATNAGGESPAGPVVAVSTGCGGETRALLVHGFYRNDQGLAPVEDLSEYGLGTVMHVIPDKMNRLDILSAHGAVLAAAGIIFDSAEATAVEAGDVALDGYALVDWALGEESTVDETFSRAEQTLVSAWLGAGRTLIVSGAELGWDLVARGDATDKAFFEALGVTYIADDAETYTLVVPGVGNLTIDDGTRGMFDVNTPDVLAAQPGASVVLRYGGGGDRAAGVRYESPARGFVAITFGIPIEAIGPASGRDAFFVNLLGDVAIDRVPVDGCGQNNPEPGPEVAPESPPDAVATDTNVGSDVGPDDAAGDDAASAEPVGGAKVLGVQREARATILPSNPGCGSGDSTGIGAALAGLLWLLMRLRPAVARRG